MGKQDARNVADRLGNWTQGRGALHQRLGTAIEDAIRQGLLPPSTRMPAERALADQLAVSRTTVVSAYDRLRADGWLNSRSGSGTWVAAGPAQVARHHAYAATVAQSPLMNLLLVDDATTIDFAAGSPIPLAELPADLYAVAPELQQALLTDRHYLPLGYPPLREAIARYYVRQGVPTEARQILVTSGAQQAISLAVSLFVQRGDTVLVESPTFFGALDALRLAGARVVALHVGDAHIDVGMLRDRVIAHRPRFVYLTPTFQNPTGAVMPAADRREVSRIAGDLDVHVIEDGTLADLSIGASSTPPPIAAHAPDSGLLSIGSLSKLFWGSLRVGWVRGPLPVISQLARLKSATDLGSPVLTQVIATQLFTALDRARAIRAEQLGQRRDVLMTLIREHLPTWQFREPAGGMFLWVRVPSVDTRYLAQCAARHGVAVTPGALFSVDGTQADRLRVPFLLEPSVLREGTERLAAAWAECAHTKAVNGMEAWPIV
jgi:DNA-binding transcriptional MocR family regulator